mmetsp:Transcript_23999/g.79770  ORF Transcript_23999/g.79770 Transcript_23999/m.79770 type:complete len:256 (-) Transcript_23999:953-1720(-)
MASVRRGAAKGGGGRRPPVLVEVRLDVDAGEGAHRELEAEADEGRPPVGLRVCAHDEREDEEGEQPGAEGVPPVDDEHDAGAEDETDQADRPVEVAEARPPVRVLEQAEQAAVEVHHRVAGEEAHRQQRRDGVERADQHAHGADQVGCGEGELRLAAGEAGERAHRAEHAVGGDGHEEAGRDDDALQRLSERGEDNPDLRRLDGGVDELVQLAVLHREVVALSDGGPEDEEGDVDAEGEGDGAEGAARDGAGRVA